MKKLIPALILASMSGAVLAQNTDNDSVKYSTDVPQTIAVSSPADPSAVAAGDVATVDWIVSSNNAFKYSFSGTSRDDSGSELGYPALHKQDVDASGNLVPNNYDILDTDTAVTIDNHQSVQYVRIWNNNLVDRNNVAKLVKPTSDSESPYGTTGRVMPGDDTSEARVRLWMRGHADQFDQSGLYNSEVMITVTADEQEV